MLFVCRLPQPKSRGAGVCCYRLLAGALLGLSLVSSAGPVARAQEIHEHDAQLDPTSRIVPETPAFQAACDALREHLKKMREAIVYFNSSESPAEEQRWKQRWYELQAAGHQLHQNMLEAALAEYKTNPAGKRELADMLHDILERNFKDDRFAGMIEIAQALRENDYESPELSQFIAMAGFATNRFDVAKPHLDALVGEGQISEQLQKMLQDFAQVQREWERELVLREQDAQGEPLPRALIKTTKGDIEVELFENQAPETVGNFIHLVEQGFYDNLDFHRVLEHFMAQGGCPNGDGLGGPGYMIYNEAQKPDARKFFRGSLGMALAQNPDTAGSQFFITFVPTPQLNNEYTVFGRVLSGLAVLSNLNRIDPENKDKNAAPVLPDQILTIEILYKRDHEYKPNKVPQ